jgi:hypothetical protein
VHGPTAAFHAEIALKSQFIPFACFSIAQTAHPVTAQDRTNAQADVYGSTSLRCLQCLFYRPGTKEKKNMRKEGEASYGTLDFLPRLCFGYMSSLYGSRDAKRSAPLPHHVTSLHYISQPASRRMRPGSLFPSSRPVAFPLLSSCIVSANSACNLPTHVEVMTPSSNGLVSPVSSHFRYGASGWWVKMWWRFQILSDHLESVEVGSGGVNRGI